MKDGRSEPPSVPDEFVDLFWTQKINRSLGTNYRPEEIKAMWIEDFIKLELWTRYGR